MNTTPNKKKVYSRPIVIEMGIEIVTGTAAGTCSKGPDVGTFGCGSGTGAGSTCTDGWGVNGLCVPGGNPYETRSLCRSNGLTASSCQSGSNALSGSSRCVMGDSALHSASYGSCVSGNADSNICGYGNGNNTASLTS